MTEVGVLVFFVFVIMLFLLRLADSLSWRHFLAFSTGTYCAASITGVLVPKFAFYNRWCEYLCFPLQSFESVKFLVSICPFLSVPACSAYVV